MRELQSPAPLAGPRPWVFLAGSIDDGRAAPWQAEVVRALDGLPGTLLNPRRDDWDSTWRQSLDDPRFVEQVTWELAAQEQADVVAMYFAPGSHAPITLMEFGLFAPLSDATRRGGELVVACPDDYWRRGNVEVACLRYGMTLLDSLDALVEEVGRRSALGEVSG